jgi:hypothetical protein
MEGPRGEPLKDPELVAQVTQVFRPYSARAGQRFMECGLAANRGMRTSSQTRLKEVLRVAALGPD